MIWAVIVLLVLLGGALFYVFKLGQRVEHVSKELDRIKNAKAQNDRINKAIAETSKEAVKSENEKQKIRGTRKLDDLVRLYEKILSD